MYDLPALTGQAACSSAVWLPGMLDIPQFELGPNDGGIKRGDRADTGDNEANPSPDVGPSGSGVRGGGGGSAGAPTADPSSLGGGPGSHSDKTGEDQEPEDGMQILDADDPDLGLTTGEGEGDDWAANTGPTRTGGDRLATEDLRDDGSTLGPKRKSS